MKRTLSMAMRTFYTHAENALPVAGKLIGLYGERSLRGKWAYAVKQCAESMEYTVRKAK